MKTQEIIKKIEKSRGSKVITYVTSDRQGPVNARVAMDIIPIISNQLRKIGKQDKIDLVLYSSGGDTMVPWRLVSMIREYCDHFSVLVPYKAHSAATMIALGADEIVMSDMSELSPIDPSTANVFNPVDPQNPQNRIPISVEDVMAYFDLAKNKFGIKSDEELTEIFKKFIDSNPSIHPLALGNVNRTHNLIKILAKRLLKSHKAPMKEDEIEKIIEFLTEKLYSHQYYIGRKEAKEDLGIKSVVFADKELSDSMTELYEEYKQEMKMTEVWNPETELGENQAMNKKLYKIAYVESAEISNYFEVNMEFKKVQQ
ncbi:MAG: hypothetical protein V1814_00005, partial [Candidatus Moraniibacteriota bacterium]